MSINSTKKILANIYINVRFNNLKRQEKQGGQIVLVFINFNKL